jgi:hypothetical protein
MAFPINPTNNQQTTINGVVYKYADATNSWQKLPTALSTLSDVDTTTAPTDGQALVWNAASGKWVAGDVAAGAGGSSAVSGFATSNFAGDGTTAEFAIGAGYTANAIMVFENGIAQTPVTDYTVSNNKVVFVTPPASGVSVQVRKFAVGGGSDDATKKAIAMTIIFGG